MARNSFKKFRRNMPSPGRGPPVETANVSLGLSSHCLAEKKTLNLNIPHLCQGPCLDDARLPRANPLQRSVGKIRKIFTFV